MNKRRRNKAVKKLLAEYEYALARLGDTRLRRKPPSLTYRERKIAETILAQQKREPDSN